LGKIYIQPTRKNENMKEEKPKKNPVIRTIYLYLFSLIGLVLVVMGSVGFIDMALKAYIFTQADAEQALWARQPPMPYALERTERIAESDQLTEDEKNAVSNWIKDYESWQERQSAIDPVTAERHRSAARNLAQILIGIPLYLYHWGIIRRETKKS
jgi:hypothetical protein